MPLRDRLRKKFGSKKSNSGSSTPDDGYPPRRSDIEYYKPHEIPKSKYKGKVDPEHKERLESYSFADAFTSAPRRASQALSGTFSPGGTKALSAAPSAAQSRRSSWMSRNQSMLATDSSGSESRDTSLTSDSSVLNGSKLDLSAANHDLPELRIQKTITLGKPSTSHNETPFSAEDLENAMSRASLRPRRGTVVGPAIQPVAA